MRHDVYLDRFRTAPSTDFVERIDDELRDKAMVVVIETAADRLDDATPGGWPIHGLLAWEEAEILALFEEWGPIDLSHRKLAHRGSYTRRVWVSPSMYGFG